MADRDYRSIEVQVSNYVYSPLTVEDNSVVETYTMTKRRPTGRASTQTSWRSGGG